MINRAPFHKALNTNNYTQLFSVVSLIISCLTLTPHSHATELDSLKTTLGKQLYFDNNLSFKRTQSCASCHAPHTGFIDDRDSLFKGAVSLGDDGVTFGDRSAPSAAYANKIPNFHKHEDGRYIGGQFWDGREKDLKGQAGGPPLNPTEMAMPDKESVMVRIKENTSYIESFKQIYGSSIFSSEDDVYAALTESIAAFEQTEFFSPFDSKYDRYLQGQYQLTEEEDLGMTLFFSEQFTNCNQCHQLNKRPGTSKETFSDYSYHNIGVPVNIRVRAHNKTPEEYRDLGLFNHPAVNDPSTMGKFKVPTLRNVAVTAPYMHNGIFNSLETVVAFYNKYNSKKKSRQINPETGAPWAPAEVDKNVSLEVLQSGPSLDEKRINALVAFMKLLTDQRYEQLIQ